MLDDDQYSDDPQLFTASVILPTRSMSEMNRIDHYPAGLVGGSLPVVDRIWYVPPTVDNGTGTYRLIPIYVTVASL